MKHTNLQKELAGILALTDVLVSKLENENLTESSKEIKDSAIEFQTILSVALNAFYDSVEVQRSTAFIKLAEKLEYNVNNLFK